MRGLERGIHEVLKASVMDGWVSAGLKTNYAV
jgi:hypothetical protein